MECGGPSIWNVVKVLCIIKRSHSNEGGGVVVAVQGGSMSKTVCFHTSEGCRNIYSVGISIGERVCRVMERSNLIGMES